MYQTKYTGQNIPYQLHTNYTLDVSVRISVKVRIRVRARVRFRDRISIRVRARVRAEWATEELPKHPIAAYF